MISAASLLSAFFWPKTTKFASDPAKKPPKIGSSIGISFRPTISPSIVYCSAMSCMPEPCGMYSTRSMPSAHGWRYDQTGMAQRLNRPDAS